MNEGMGLSDSCRRAPSGIAWNVESVILLEGKGYLV